MNVIEAKEVLVTHTHLALSLEYAAGGSLTSYVADRWQHSQHSGLFLSEDEARYFFRVSMQYSKGATIPTIGAAYLLSSLETVCACRSQLNLCVRPAAIHWGRGILPSALGSPQVWSPDVAQFIHASCSLLSGD